MPHRVIEVPVVGHGLHGCIGSAASLEALRCIFRQAHPKRRVCQHLPPETVHPPKPLNPHLLFRAAHRLMPGIGIQVTGQKVLVSERRARTAARHTVLVGQAAAKGRVLARDAAPQAPGAGFRVIARLRLQRPPKGCCTVDGLTRWGPADLELHGRQRTTLPPGVQAALVSCGQCRIQSRRWGLVQEGRSSGKNEAADPADKVQHRHWGAARRWLA
mmetsp:Transcript_80496/g.250265  ORF Transcript_80496/g.250265 Transcript_80496/m.250265 type:complete len:216 (-) Transcript_80496:33-680(-)